MKEWLVYVIAGEPSGDLLAAGLMRALKERAPVRFAGIGGALMREEGLVSLFPQSDLAIMGFVEVVPRIPRILARLRQTLADIEKCQPDLIVTIDSWGFTGRVAKALKRSGSPIPRLHYVAPMVWAWKEKRAKTLAERVDRLLCLLPNEPEYFGRHGLTAVHVGHPVLERLDQSGDGAGFRQRHGIAADATLIAFLPGSRHSEISRLLPVFAETATMMAERFPDLRIVIPTVENVSDAVRGAVAHWPVAPLVVGPDEKWDCFAACRVALAASGTVALELAVARLPMVITYRIAPLTALILRRLIKIRFACLLNLVVDRSIVPEYLQEDCRAENLANALADLLADATSRQQQLDDCLESLELLGVDGESPSRRAAREALTMIEEKSP